MKKQEVPTTPVVDGDELPERTGANSRKSRRKHAPTQDIDHLLREGEAIELSLLERHGSYGAIVIETGEIIKRDHTLQHIPIMPEKAPYKRREYTLDLTINGKVGVQLQPGITIISGATAAGKSGMIRALNKVDRVITVEPPDGVEELESTYIFDDVDQAVLFAARSTVKTGRLHAIDSLRAPLFEINGPAGSKGVIMPFFTAITRLSNSLARHGISMLATVNPMDDDPEYVRQFLNKLSASVPAYIDLSSATAEGFSGRITVRMPGARPTSAFTLPIHRTSEVTSEEVAFVMPEAEESIQLFSPLQVQIFQSND
jgi:hypothetical protein